MDGILGPARFNTVADGDELRDLSLQGFQKRIVGLGATGCHYGIRLQGLLADYYWTGARHFLGCTHRQFDSTYRAARLSRNLQVLGAYGFLGRTKGKREFLQYIPRAFKELKGWLKHSCEGKYPKLEKVVAGVKKTFA